MATMRDTKQEQPSPAQQHIVAKMIKTSLYTNPAAWCENGDDLELLTHSSGLEMRLTPTFCIVNKPVAMFIDYEIAPTIWDAFIRWQVDKVASLLDLDIRDFDGDA